MPTFREKLEEHGVSHPGDIECAVEYLTKISQLLQECADGMPAGTILPSSVVACHFMLRTMKRHIASASQAQVAFLALAGEKKVDPEPAELFLTKFSPRACQLARETTSGSIHSQVIMELALESLAESLETKIKEMNTTTGEN